MTDCSGDVVATYSYDPWGKLLSSTGSIVNPFRYSGYYYDDATGLYCLGHRYYDPGVRRFLTCDSAPGVAGLSQSLNRYVYALDNPTKFVDDSGTTSRLSPQNGGEPSYIDEMFDYAVEQGCKPGQSKLNQFLYGSEALLLSLVTSDNAPTTFMVLGGACGFSRSLANPQLEFTPEGRLEQLAQQAESSNPIGRGTNYNMPRGGCVKQAFDYISRGFPVKPISTSYGPGEVSELPDGTKIMWRAGSSSGDPTIQVDSPDGSQIKFRFPK
jgi:RHS repeat-associated protein